MTETFSIVPSEDRLLWFILGFVILILVSVAFVLVATARGSRSSTFEVSPTGLRIRGDIYGRLVPASAIRGSDARVVNLATEGNLEPRRRTAGTAVPGYHSGWFRLRNGEKALLYLTERGRAVYVPTTEGYSLLLSPQDPDRFVDRVRAIAGGG